MPAFKGQFDLDRPLSKEHQQTLSDFIRLSPSGPDTPPRGCHWMLTTNGTAIVWDGGEKFWAFQEWLVYLIAQFFDPWEYLLSGEVTYDEAYDSPIGGTLYLRDNQIERVPDLIPNPQQIPS